MKTCSLLLIFSGMVWSTAAQADDTTATMVAVAEDGMSAGKADGMLADNNNDDDEGYGKSKDKNKDKSGKSGKAGKHGRGVSVLLPVTNDMYRQECTACHFAYLPGLLPAASWHQMMSSLDDHFGENASLEDQAVIGEINAFLEGYAADTSRARLSVRIMRDLKGKPAPAGVTNIRYIRRQHHEISERMISGNKKVRTLANCIACHSGAETGVFDEDGVKIPGYGYWED